MTYLAKTPDSLLPCPHCGGEAEARDGSSTTPYIRCKSCGCRTGSSRDMDRLKEAWNRRFDRTYRMDYDPVHCDYICTSCGERYETDMYISISGDDRRFFKPMRYCPNCGARVINDGA